MGGLSGGSSADAVAGAQAGKNAVENNLMGGNEWSQVRKPESMVRMFCRVQTILQEKPVSEAETENKAYAGSTGYRRRRYYPVPHRRCGVGRRANAGAQC